MIITVMERERNKQEDVTDKNTQMIWKMIISLSLARSLNAIFIIQLVGFIPTLFLSILRQYG